MLSALILVPKSHEFSICFRCVVYLVVGVVWESIVLDLGLLWGPLFASRSDLFDDFFVFLKKPENR